MKKLSESIWADIYDRSTGETVRKEDDVNLLDMDDMFDYIESHYKTTTSFIISRYKSPYSMILVPISINSYYDTSSVSQLCLDGFSGLQVTIDARSFNRLPVGCYPKLKEKYNLTRKGESSRKQAHIIISPKDNSPVTNSFFLEVLDFLLDNIKAGHGYVKLVKKVVNESIWADIYDRSTGETVRKEDDVNLLDLEDFYAYIKEHYKTKVEYIDLDSMGPGNGDVIDVDITENIILFYKPKRGHILLSWSRVKIPFPFFDELADRFKIENPNSMRRIITEKDGSCTNKTFIDVIDFFLGHKESLINESIWADIYDRSTGDTVRKEDDIENLGRDELFDYIFSIYELGDVYSHPLKSQTSNEKTFFSIPLFKINFHVYRLIVSFTNDKIVSILIWAYKGAIKEIEDVLMKNFTLIFNDDKGITIKSKDGEVTNQVCLDLIRIVSENIGDPMLIKKED